MTRQPSAKSRRDPDELGHSESDSVPLLLSLEFARADQSGDAHGFRFAPQEYLLRRDGGKFKSSRFPWDAQLLMDLQSLRLPVRDPAVLQKIGETLRKFLEPMGWETHEEQVLAAVAEGRAVFFTIRSAAAELYSLPWELCTLEATGQHIGELPGILLRYEWPGTHSAPEHQSQREAGRVLFAWSAAGGSVPAADQLAALKKACAAGFYPFDDQRDVLANASCGLLSSTLRAAKQEGRLIAILHILCHGSPIGSTFGLALDEEHLGGGRVVVDAARLRQILAPHADMIRLVILTACDTGNSGTLGNQLGSVAQALHRAGIVQVVASRYPLSVLGSIRLTEALYDGLLRVPASVETALVAARQYLAEDAAQLDWASVQLYARSEDGQDSRPVVFRPFRGLLAFGPEQRRFLFGRQEEIRQTIAALHLLRSSGRPRFLLVAGASGTGKSSMVLAGVVPELLGAGQDGWQAATIKPGSQPLATLRHALAKRSDPSAPFLLVVDQFEEIFTNKIPPAEQHAFATQLWALAQQSGSGLHVILTLRVDFIGLCGGVILDAVGTRLDRIAYDEAHRIFVPQMRHDQIIEAICRPVQLVGLQLEAGLPERLVEDCRGEPGALPLLQDTLDLLWQNRRGRQLTQESYDAMGGVAGALRSQAEALFHSLAEADQQLVRHLLVRLVSRREDTALDTRRRRLLSEVRPRDAAAGERFDALLVLLVERRLIVRSEEGQQPTLEIAHEALIRRWDRLRRFIAERRQLLMQLDQLEQWGKVWQAHGTLLDAKQLVVVEDLERYSPEDLSPVVQQLLDASRAWQAERRRRLQEAIELANALLVSIDTQLRSLAGAAALQRELLDKTARLLDNLLFEAPNDPAVLRTRMIAHHRRGDLALSHDRLTDALTEYQSAMMIAALLAKEGPHDTQAQSDQSVCWRRLGKVLLKLGHLARAAEAYAQAIAMLDNLVRQEPYCTDLQYDLAYSFDQQGKVALRQDRIDIAVRAHEQARALYQELAKQNTKDVELQRDRAYCLNNLGDAMWKQGRLAEATALYRQALPIIQDMADRDPRNAGWQRGLAYCCNRLGRIMLVQGDADESESFHKRALQLIQELAEQDPDNITWQRDLAFCWNRLGKVAARQGQLAAAAAAHEKALALIQPLLVRDSQNVDIQEDLSYCWSRIAGVAVQQGQLAAAAAAYETVQNVLQNMTAQNPENPRSVLWLADNALRLAAVRRRQPEHQQESATLLIRAEQLIEQLRQQGPDSAAFVAKLSEALAKHRST